MIRNIYNYFRENKLTLILIILLSISSIIVLRIGDFQIGLLRFSTIVWSIMIWIIGNIASKNLGPFIFLRIKDKYSKALYPQEFRQLSTSMIENNELGFILLTVSNIAYLIYRDIEGYFIMFDSNLPIVLVVGAVLRGAVFGVFAIQLIRFIAGFLILIEILLLPHVRKTPSVQDDQLLKYVINTATYLTALFVGYKWIIVTSLLDIEFNGDGIPVAIIITAIGFSFRNLLYDVVSSVIIIIERRFQLKDYIEIDGTVGKILEIGIRHTTLKGIDSAVFTVPNSDLVSKKVVNHSDKVDETITYSFTIKDDNDRERVKKFEEAILGFICEKCGPVSDKEISNHTRVSMIDTKAEMGYIFYNIKFTVRITEIVEGTVTSGKGKYWLHIKKKEEVTALLSNEIHRLAKSMEIQTR